MFIEEILKYNSIAIVGLAKNAGKTECLNYILRKVKNTGKRFALTSIGIDGENRDQVCQTPKPEIEIFEDMIFITSEMPLPVETSGGRDHGCQHTTNLVRTSGNRQSCQFGESLVIRACRHGIIESPHPRDETF